MCWQPSSAIDPRRRAARFFVYGRYSAQTRSTHSRPTRSRSAPVAQKTQQPGLADTIVLRLGNATGNRRFPGLSLPAAVVRFGRSGELVPNLSLRLTAMVLALVLLSHTAAV